MADLTGIPWKRLSIEAVAIVGSILLAFAIDAWWEERLDQYLGVEYERRFVHELSEIRTVLGTIERGLLRNIDSGEIASEFFDVDGKPIDHDHLIVSLYNMGRDSPITFDDSTYQDIVSSGRLGLIGDVARRQAIQRAYRRVQELEGVLRPHREEYLAGVRAWIPLRVVNQIREACPNITAQVWTCIASKIDIDDQVTEQIIEKISSDQALVAFRLREQGLPGTLGPARRAIQAVEEALSLLRLIR